jgi:hypothetical protein
MLICSRFNVICIDYSVKIIKIKHKKKIKILNDLYIMSD